MTLLVVQVMRDPNGISRGSGFVAFSTPDEASRAVSRLTYYCSKIYKKSGFKQQLQIKRHKLNQLLTRKENHVTLCCRIFKSIKKYSE